MNILGLKVMLVKDYNQIVDLNNKLVDQLNISTETLMKMNKTVEALLAPPLREMKQDNASFFNHLADNTFVGSMDPASASDKDIDSIRVVKMTARPVTSK